MPVPEFDLSLCWFRRDLRSFDHAGLHCALTSSRRVIGVFVFDREILDALPDPADRRVEFILESVAELDRALREAGGGLLVQNDRAREAIPRLARELGAQAVFANHDYEPSALARDDAIARALAAHGIALRTCKDQVVFEKSELLSQAGKPFSVFTPYKKAWLGAVTPDHLRAHDVDRHLARLAPPPPCRLPTLENLGFRRTNLAALGIPTGMSGGRRLFDAFLGRIDRYHETRDFPARNGPSYLSVHLRFGTVSIRHLAREAHGRALAGSTGAHTWLSELIWRDFYFQILHHHPRVVGHAFKAEYDSLPFPNDPRHFAAWREGRTGYPIVDAAMRQLNQTGYMHNRLRMIAASFLVKDLLVDWRWGERYFADKLNDFDLAANNGGWQWAASTGCDAQPYFRIFNPISQSQKFDPDGAFIRRYVPELSAVEAKAIHAPWQLERAAQEAAGMVIGRDYPPPIVDHARAREAALRLFKGRAGRRS